MMKIACLRCKRALARVTAAGREIPPDGALTRHLAKCKECARELAWFQAAHHDLQISLTADQAGTGFTEAAWARFSAANRPRRSFTGVVMAASAACAATIAVALLVRNAPTSTRFPSPDRTNSVSSKPAANLDTGPLAAKKNPKKPLVGTGIAVTQPEKNASDPPAPIRHRRIRFTHDKRRIAHRKHTKVGATLVAAANKRSPGTQSVSWEQLASWYEYQGDYRSAEATYLQAVRVAPTEAHLFNAGRTSECAGDVAQAVEYYTHVLKHEHKQESPSQQGLPTEKEISPWNEHPHSI